MRQNSSSSLCLSYDGSASSIDGLGRRISSGPGGGGATGGSAKDFFNAMPAAAFAAPMASRSFNNSGIFMKMAVNGDRIATTAPPTNGQIGGGVLGAAPPSSTQGTGHQEFSLNVICSALINQDQLWRLFDIIPGLDYCQIMGDSGPNANRAVVKYNNLESCMYAKDKLHGLEYPLGERLIVKMDGATAANALLGTVPGTVSTSVSPSGTGARGQLNTSGSGGGGTNDLPMIDSRDGCGGNLCSVSLPPPAQLAHAGTACAQRCFLVCVSQVRVLRKSEMVCQPVKLSRSSLISRHSPFQYCGTYLVALAI